MCGSATHTVATPVAGEESDGSSSSDEDMPLSRLTKLRAKNFVEKNAREVRSDKDHGLWLQTCKVNSGKEWKVRRIVDKIVDTVTGDTLYEVEWVGWKYSTLEPAECLENAQDALTDFNRSYGQRPKRPRDKCR